MELIDCTRTFIQGGERRRMHGIVLLYSECLLLDKNDVT